VGPPLGCGVGCAVGGHGQRQVVGAWQRWQDQDRTEPGQGSPDQVHQDHRTEHYRERTAALGPSVATTTGNEPSRRGQGTIEHLYPWPIGRVTDTN
jgi:hypothetical protein